MNKLSIEELKRMRMLAEVTYVAGAKFSIPPKQALALLGELISLSELKGDQVPVTWPDMPFSFEELEQMHGATFANGYIRGWERKCESVTMRGPLFTDPQKPVVISPNRKDMFWTASNAGFVAKCDNEWKAAIEAAGGIVKEG